MHNNSSNNNNLLYDISDDNSISIELNESMNQLI